MQMKPHTRNEEGACMGNREAADEGKKVLSPFASLKKLNQSCNTVTQSQTFLTLVRVAVALLFGHRLLLSPKKVS